MSTAVGLSVRGKINVWVAFFYCNSFAERKSAASPNFWSCVWWVWVVHLVTPNSITRIHTRFTFFTVGSDPAWASVSLGIKCALCSFTAKSNKQNVSCKKVSLLSYIFTPVVYLNYFYSSLLILNTAVCFTNVYPIHNKLFHLKQINKRAHLTICGFAASLTWLIWIKLINCAKVYLIRNIQLLTLSNL